MKRDYTNLDRFLDERLFDAHPNYDYQNESNSTIAKDSIDKLFSHGLKTGDLFLDVGCGNGRDLIYAKSKGLHVLGVNFLEIDAKKCEDQNITILINDQSFLDIDNEFVDCLFSRHCLEHSIFPYFTLVEYNRVIKTNGLLYVELPAPDQKGGQHETNPNHYSVMGRRMWEDLFERTGFEKLESYDVDFNVEDTNVEEYKNGEVVDKYLLYFLRKKTLPHAGWFRNKKV